MTCHFILIAFIVITLIDLIMADLPSVRRNVVKTFDANTFVPRSGPFGLFTDKHWQTIIGSEALQQKFTGPYPRTFSEVRERINTPDGDFLDLDFVSFEAQDESVTSKCTAKKATVVILHGLESNTKGPLVTKMTNAFLSKGFSCCLVSFRGCSGEDNLTRGAYHVGFTKDVDLVCKTLQERNPDTPIYLSGFSLGGNICLKFLGELGDAAHTRNIMGAAVFCVPFDTVGCQAKIDQGFNKAVYSKNFLNSLKKKAERQYERFGKETPDFIDIKMIRECSKIGDFDEAYIAKIYGFKDKLDYYTQSGSKQYLHKIRVPTVAINAIDDPLVEESTLPTEENDIGDAPVRLIYTPNGGHCGYMEKKTKASAPHGWISEELSRVLEHIYDEPSLTVAPFVASDRVGVSAGVSVGGDAVFLVQSVPAPVDVLSVPLEACGASDDVTIATVSARTDAADSDALAVDQVVVVIDTVVDTTVDTTAQKLP